MSLAFMVVSRSKTLDAGTMRRQGPFDTRENAEKFRSDASREFPDRVYEIEEPSS
jgi:hypothetical protein